MLGYIRSKLSEDAGIAMVIVLLAVVIVTVLGAFLVISGTRDLQSSTSVQRASTALGLAEAGVQQAIQHLKLFGPISDNVSKLYVDDSCAPNPSVPACQDTGAGATPGQGRWMNADDPTTGLDERTVTPTFTDQFVGNIGTGLYRGYIRAVNPVKPPGLTTGVYKIVSTGYDRRDRPTRPGERTVEQFIKVQLLKLPFGLFAQAGVDVGGTPKVLNESVWTTGDIYFRSSVDFQPMSPPDPACPYSEGCDLFYGWNGTQCGESPSGASKCPNAAHATGTIYLGNGQGNQANNGPIHKAPFPNGYQHCDVPYDRDKYGGPYDPPGWQSGGASCAPQSSLAPPYSSSLIASAAADFPFELGGPSEDVYQFMKQMAQSTGTFCTHTAASTAGITAAGNPGSTKPCERIAINQVPKGFFVLYVESSPSAGAITIQTGWGCQSSQPDQQDCDPASVSSCDPDGNFGVVIVRNGNLGWQNNETWWGAAFVPEGTFSGAGTGAGGWLVGTVYARNIGATGNMKFQLNNCWVNDLAGPWWAVSRLRWHESDR